MSCLFSIQTKNPQICIKLVKIMFTYKTKWLAGKEVLMREIKCQTVFSLDVSFSIVAITVPYILTLSYTCLNGFENRYMTKARVIIGEN